jgi:cell division protease FtsH
MLRRFPRLLSPPSPPSPPLPPTFPQVHAKGKQLSADVDLLALARRTSGFSGAELATLLNEAAIGTATRNSTLITASDVDTALDKQLIGLRRPSHATPRVRSIVAVHEAGHACVALLNGYDNVSRVTILPRSNGVGGFTAFANAHAEDGAGMPTRERLLKQLQVNLGGRVAEELAFGKGQVTVGASGDLRKVHDLALAMVTEYGMVLDDLGLTSSSSSRYSPSSVPEAVRRRVARAVDQLLKQAYAESRRSLQLNWRLVSEMKEALLEKETLSAAEIDDMFIKYKATSPAFSLWSSVSGFTKWLPSLPRLQALPLPTFASSHPALEPPAEGEQTGDAQPAPAS